MRSGIPYYYRSLDYRQLVEQYPPAPDYFDSIWLWPRERIEELQRHRLREAAIRAWTIPFHRRRWKKAGVGPDDLQGLSDLGRIPWYTIDDIRDSLERYPPLGDYHPLTLGDARQMPLRIFWSGGTTGEPRPTVYTPWDREVGAILTARTFYLHGLRPGDIVINAWAYSIHNAAWIMDHALWQWMGCVPLTTSTGIVTPTRRQLELARRYGATSILATSDYLLHMAGVATQMGCDPKTDFKIRTLSVCGDPRPVREAWGCPAYDSYAFHEVNFVAAECPVAGGLHIFEDAFVVEVVDFESGELLPAGQLGNLVVTCLYKTGTQQFRYNVQDISRLYENGQCACGSWMRRMDYFQGRSDSMIKLRGLNIWPEACGRVVQGDLRLTGEYFCIVDRVDTGTGPRDEMTVLVELADQCVDRDTVKGEIEERFRRTLGVRLAVGLVGPGELATLTGHSIRAKAKRFEDRRKRS